MRVIVIGAGLGGLALAQSLLRAGVAVDVYERDAGLEARFQGYRIGLGDRGLPALKRCLPERLHPLLHAVSGDMAGEGRAVDTRLNELGRTPVQDEGLLFDRHVLRHLLHAGLDGHVHFGKRFDAYEPLPGGGVRAFFDDGTTVTGDLLVGADGMGSAVCRQLLPSVEILDTGVAGVIGRTPLTPELAPLVPGWSTLVQDGNLNLFIGKMPFRRPPHEAAAELAPDVKLPETSSYLRWVLLLPPGAHEASEEVRDGVDFVADLVRGWHPLLRAMIREADRGNSGLGPIRYADPLPAWEPGPVTLLGDSAHPMPPGGLGANLAFQDAVSLRDELAPVARGEAPLLPALAAHQQRMRDTAASVHSAAMATLRMITRT
ncbi:FAD-dependent oxidoreductase [Sphaerisporangium aureirubrum]|uniref:FAD-dependent oxidoreductase n=1 Tax=Sphaerisporangium aureirubrum TaxID=1544736 RepID=A0ABW1NTW2_9ACTN